MVDRVIGKPSLADSIDMLADRYRLLAPVETHGRYRFTQVHDSGELGASYVPSSLPPSKFLRPPRETLLEFDWKDGFAVDAVFDAEDHILFGVRPCDLHAIQLLDEIFDREKDDGHYLARRTGASIIGIECLEPCDDKAFCHSMGTLEATTGYDILLTDMGDGYHVRVGTDKGRQLVNQLTDARDAVYEDRKRLRMIYQDREDAFEPALDVHGSQIPALLADSEDSLLWDVLGEKCLSCAACTNACPTCFCFDVLDDVGLDMTSGERYRAWDSCLLEEFAMVGTGESFRQPRNMRVKHRFNHKGRYLFERYGMPGCVGCGRCARDCLVGIDPIEVFNQLKGRPVER